ncbi:MAG: TRAP transporter substrate-binding protein [Rhodospirillales bacterium]|nr:TRAP transporter substrate-binding protein [Rhodospirillales bacterium]
MRKYVAALLGAAVGAAMTASAAHAETTLRVANWLPPTHPIMKDMVVPWGKMVEEATKGKVKVEVLPAPLGAPPAHFDIAKDGIADVTYSVHGYTPGRFALTDVAELPFLGNSAEAISIAYWRTTEKYFAKADEHKGVKLLSVFVHGPGHIFNAKRPIKAVGDLKDLKIRVGGGIINDISKELGIVPIHAPSPKSYEILTNGVADGIMFPSESVPFFKIDKALKYMTEVPDGLYNTSFFLVMNQAKFESLSKDEQAALMSVSGEAFARLAGKAWDAADAAGMTAIKAAGIEVSKLDDAAMAELKKRLAFAEAKWLDKAKERGVDGLAALSYMRAEIAKLSK